MDFSSVDIDSYDKYTFGRCIKEQREELGISLRSVAAKIGISAAYLSDIEKGRRYAPTETNKNDIIYKLVKVLDIPNEQLEYLYDMIYASRGYHKDIMEYLSGCEKARKFIRCAKDFELSDEQWELLFERLNEIKEQDAITRVYKSDDRKN